MSFRGDPASSLPGDVTEPATSPGLRAGAGTGPAYELKFELLQKDVPRMKEWARRHLHPDPHGEDGCYQVTSVYCDTDSVISTEERMENVGDQLGQFKKEGSFFDFEALAPKTYAYVDAETGEFIAKSKGIPNAARNFHHLRSGVSLERGVNTFRGAARGGRGLFTRKSATRMVRSDGLHFGDRVLREDGKTWPVDVTELEK